MTDPCDSFPYDVFSERCLDCPYNEDNYPEVRSDE